MCGFGAVATKWLITHHCLLSILDGLDYMFGEKHWNGGVSAGTGIIVVFTWQSRRVSEIASRTEQRGCLGYSVLDAGLSCTKGVWYIYDWDTGSSILI